MNELLIQYNRAKNVLDDVTLNLIMAYCDGLITIEEIKKYDFCLACNVYHSFINFYTDDSITIFEAEQFVVSV